MYISFSGEMNSYRHASESRIFAGKLYTLYNMIYGCNVKEIAVLADHLSAIAHRDDWHDPNPEEFVKDLIASSKKLGKFYLPATMRGIQHYLNIGDPAIEENRSKWDKRSRREICEDILRRMKEDLEKYVFVALELHEAVYYQQRSPFGALVAKKFPEFSEDIREAMRCFTFGCYRASAYHVSVLMENAARRLAKRVKLTPPRGKRIADIGWQNLSDQITRKIQLRPRSTARQKALNEMLSEANNHLWDVKEAYRNKIAHGKMAHSKRTKHWKDNESRLTYILLQQAEHFFQFLARLMT